MPDPLDHLEPTSRQLDPSPDQRAILFEQVMQHAHAFLDRIPSAPAHHAYENRADFLRQAAITEEGIDLGQALAIIRAGVEESGIEVTSGRFLGFIPGGGLVQSALGDFLAAVSNRYAGVFAGSPGAVDLENTLLAWLSGVIGYPSSAAGNLASGGSIANLSAIVAARDARGVLESPVQQSVIYLTTHVHHCIHKALHIAGLDGCTRRIIPVDGHFRMRADALAGQIEADKQAGLSPWLLIASAGTTNTGSVDPLNALADIAEQHGLWLHVDGAYGGLFRLCAAGAAVLGGIERSASVVIDPHKTLFLPYGTGAVLLREAAHLLRSFGEDEAEYMEFVRDPQKLSPADLSPELTKHFRGLRLWLPLKLLGVAPFRAAMSEKIQLARYFYAQMQAMNGFELATEPDLSVVVYRYVPARGEADAFNQRLMEAVNAEGRVYISSTRLDGALWLRAAILSFRTHRAEIDAALERLGHHAGVLAGE